MNRETNSVVNGRIELRRSGDILVATNGIERLIPRQLPFEHNGFGQDNEWVAANFTNANEILSVGYSEWVDDQVGVDLTNGLYKLTVTVPEKPLETTQLKVGDYSVAVIRYTARRRNNGNYDEWQLLYNAGRDVSIPTPSAGVFALKARLVYGTQSNETAYVHMESEWYCHEIKERIGPCEEGDYDHFGVARSDGMLRLRNAALSHLGLAEYGYMMFLPSKNGFSKVKEEKWKCNRFVADVAIEAGFSVSKNQTVPMIGNVYPPTANDWAMGIGLGDWLHLGYAYPEPGFIASRYNPRGPGHCGIVDYDGWTISARENGISRYEDTTVSNFFVRLRQQAINYGETNSVNWCNDVLSGEWAKDHLQMEAAGAL